MQRNCTFFANQIFVLIIFTISETQLPCLEVFAPAPEPKAELGRYRNLSSTAGVRVSPLCLGAMSLGTGWADFMGSVDREKALELLDAFFDAGGNFIDTANLYQNEESEKFIGEWMEARKCHDLMFIATKYTTNYRSWELG